jgi:hypothetical protein
VFSEKPTVYDPIDRSKLFAGHWVHFEGCLLTQDVPAETGETEIHVEKPQCFRFASDASEGRSNLGDDLCLCALRPDGKPDWNRSEQVKLVSVAAARGSIRVRRARYGTRPLALRAGESWGAAHVSEAWGYQGGSWAVNYCHCPQDAQGRTAADILQNSVVCPAAPWPTTRPEFDVMPRPESGLGKRPQADTDGDIGRRRLPRRAPPRRRVCGALRESLGHANCSWPTAARVPSTSALQHPQRIENEWYAGGGMTLHWSRSEPQRFWHQNAHPPAFSYFIHKFGHTGETFGAVSRHRLRWPP